MEDEFQELDVRQEGNNTKGDKSLVCLFESKMVEFEYILFQVSKPS